MRRNTREFGRHWTELKMACTSKSILVSYQERKEVVKIEAAADICNLESLSQQFQLEYTLEYDVISILTFLDII